MGQVELARRLAPLPYARHTVDTYREIATSFAALPMAPLLVRARLATPYAETHAPSAVHLDGLLGAAVVRGLPYATHYPSDSAAVVPIPLRLLWVSAEGRPLWAASDLWPSGRVTRSREYWHKRHADSRAPLASRMRANTSAGRWKEYRVPLQLAEPDDLRAVCVGHEDTVRSLLVDHATHIGKKAGSGHGYVAAWTVEPLPLEDPEAILLCLLHRPVPAAYLVESGTSLPPGAVVRQGWTPPYWFSPWHGDARSPDVPPDSFGLPAHAEGERPVDWYEAVDRL
jgi:CRISPR type IV-associated protein Csf3